MSIEYEEKLIATITEALKAIPAAPPVAVVADYLGALRSILHSFRASGIDTAKISAEMCGALGAKDIAGYVGLACELGAANHFRTLVPAQFKYRVHNASSDHDNGIPKSFDFSATVDGFTFNVEVKTFSRINGGGNQHPVKVFLPKAEMKALYAEMRTAGSGFSPNCTPAIGRFLADANVQLRRPENGLAVIVLCCDGFDEYADAMECLAGQHGLLSNNRKPVGDPMQPTPQELPNIDAVVVCVAGLHHYGLMDPDRYGAAFGNDLVLASGKSSWQFAQSLPVAVFLRSPPQRELEETFGKAFNLHNAMFSELLREHGGDIQSASFAMFNRALTG
ncbi:hypothetical protein [Massilia sp. YMA4]|uniref:hypothetical protein n=1 Tax=Massilia sp. YMA4 TaxID=1593482 RepID=UPI000DD15513|nr:hypothetical protein [Massilia sp. YMA4]AXA91723.1 hypothetical protein DPH57_11540 [Massilia sp. YMA4]